MTNNVHQSTIVQNRLELLVWARHEQQYTTLLTWGTRFAVRDVTETLENQGSSTSTTRSKSTTSVTASSRTTNGTCTDAVLIGHTVLKTCETKISKIEYSCRETTRVGIILTWRCTVPANRRESSSRWGNRSAAEEFSTGPYVEVCSRREWWPCFLNFFFYDKSAGDVRRTDGIASTAKSE